MALDSSQLADDIRTALTDEILNDMLPQYESDIQNASPPWEAQKVKEEFWKRLIERIADVVADKVVQHIKDDAEVYLDPPIQTIEVYAAGVGTNGGTLQTPTGGPVNGEVKTANLTARVK